MNRVVVAGTGASQAVAEAIYRPLASRGRIVALEAAGWAHTSLSVEKVASSLTGPTDLIGHSQGGLVAALVAVRHPHLVRRLVTIGAPLRGTPLAQRWMPVPSLRCMTVDSRACAELDGLWDRFDPENALMVAGGRDYLVPSTSAAPYGPCATRLFPVGHIRLVRDPAVIGFIDGWLTQTAARAAA